MKKRNRLIWLAALSIACVISALSASVVLAHEQRTVGKYTFVVGLLNEPAYTDFPNALDLRVTETQSGKPVEGLEKTLQANAIFGASTMPLTLRARFGQPGAYLADLVPTKPGSYIFHFTGNVADQAVDEKFESGPGRFDDVTDLTALQFPQKAPAALELATQVQAAQSAAATAQIFGMIGIGVGVLGVIVGAVALMRRQ